MFEVPCFIYNVFSFTFFGHCRNLVHNSLDLDSLQLYQSCNRSFNTSCNFPYQKDIFTFCIIIDLFLMNLFLTGKLAVSMATEEISRPAATSRFDLDSPRWDQSTFIGRFKHFLNITDARLVLCRNQTLEDAKDLVTKYK